MLSVSPAAAQFQVSDPNAPPVPADIIYENGQVYTPKGWVSGIAISGGTIIALGDSREVEKHKSAKTKVIDLKNGTVLPGFHDMHVHPMGAGLGELQCQIPHGSSPQQIFDITAACVKKSKPGEWITGRAYEADSFGATPPNKEMLDKVAPNNPVIFTDISGHSSWANSAALKVAGVTRDTPNPVNGIIERDASGEPTGLLRETAAGLVSRFVPPASREKNAAALKWALDDMLSLGITAFDDAGVSEDVAIAYADLADRGELKQRVRGCLWARDPKVIEHRDIYTRDRFSPTCVKVVLDGVPTDGHTAAMVDDYEPLPGSHGEGREKGLLMVPPAELNALVTKLDADGLTVKFHAAGDAAVRAGLDAIEAARKTNGFSGLMHNVGHNSFVKITDIARARDIGAAFEFSPYIWYPSPIIGDIRKAVGEERMKRWIPVKDALVFGALSVPGSDWAVVPSSNPWIALETLVTRQKPGGGGEALGEAEKITLDEAFDMFTMASARQQNNSALTGSIEIGKAADIIVVDQNIFKIPITDVHKTKVLMTIIEGETVYQSK